MCKNSAYISTAARRRIFPPPGLSWLATPQSKSFHRGLNQRPGGSVDLSGVLNAGAHELSPFPISIENTLDPGGDHCVGLDDRRGPRSGLGSRWVPVFAKADFHGDYVHLSVPEMPYSGAEGRGEGMRSGPGRT